MLLNIAITVLSINIRPYQTLREPKMYTYKHLVVDRLIFRD